MPDLQVRNLTVEFDSGGYLVRPLDNLTFDANEGELLAVLGPSGCGKTTLLSCLAGLLLPSAGSIYHRGRSIGELNRQALNMYRRDTVGVVFQAFNLIPSLTALGNVMLPLRAAHISRSQSMARAQELLDTVGLSERADFQPRKMSGGQQQRVAIARALAHDPPLVLADEPTAHLDHIQVEGILRLLRKLASPGRLVIVVTHDDRISNIADRVLELAPRLASSEREPEVIELVPGEMLFRQGDRGDSVYVVESGEIETYLITAHGGDERLNVVRPGAYFGELGPMLGLPRSASARALTSCRLTAYPLRAFRQLFPTSNSAVSTSRTSRGGDGERSREDKGANPSVHRRSVPAHSLNRGEQHAPEEGVSH